MINDSIEVELNLTVAREKGREEEERIKNEDLTQLLPYNTPEGSINERMEAIERLME